MHGRWSTPSAKGTYGTACADGRLWKCAKGERHAGELQDRRAHTRKRRWPYTCGESSIRFQRYERRRANMRKGESSRTHITDAYTHLRVTAKPAGRAYSCIDPKPNRTAYIARILPEWAHCLSVTRSYTSETIPSLSALKLSRSRLRIQCTKDNSQTLSEACLFLFTLVV